MESFLTTYATTFTGEQLLDIISSPYGRHFCETLSVEDA